MLTCQTDKRHPRYVHSSMVPFMAYPSLKIGRAPKKKAILQLFDVQGRGVGFQEGDQFNAPFREFAEKTHHNTAQSSSSFFRGPSNQNSKAISTARSVVGSPIILKDSPLIAI